jgi:hypothetical protein
MSHLYVPLERQLRERLDDLARRERRHPRDQAAVLLEEALDLHRHPVYVEGDSPVQRATIAPDHSQR